MMSAPLIVSIPHRLGREEATRRLKAGPMFMGTGILYAAVKLKKGCLAV